MIAVTTNIESIEFRRRESVAHGFEEHLRAGTTDDVEAFFALLHHFLGLVFHLEGLQGSLEKTDQVRLISILSQNNVFSPGVFTELSIDLSHIKDVTVRQ